MTMVQTHLPQRGCLFVSPLPLATGLFRALRSGTPLQIKLADSSLVVQLFLPFIMFSVARWNVSDNVAIATAIAIIPDLLVAVLTLTMTTAVGTWKMAKENVIIRKLDALESLGMVTDICSEKQR
jgi:Na+-exporting ATPase